jgi:histidine phosphotransferase ChpT
MTVAEAEAAIAVLEATAARLCHDLIGPVGAIGNGMELLRDGAGAAADRQIIDLVEDAARSAGVRLKLFRAALGSGQALGAVRPLGEARALAQAMFATGRVRLDWPDPDPTVQSAATSDRARLLLNLLLVAAEALPLGGTLRVDARISAAQGGPKVAVAALGPRAALPDAQRAALLSTDAAIAPRCVPAWLAARLAIAQEARLDVEIEAPERVVVAVAWSGPG